MPTKKIVEKKNLALKKEKEIKEIATLIKKKPKLEIEKKKKTKPPKIIKKPEIIKNKQIKLKTDKKLLIATYSPTLRNESLNSYKEEINYYKKIAQETIFSDLNNVVGFLKKYVIDEELDEIYRVDTNNKDNNITNLR